eukprot:g3362.t1
MVYSAYRKMQLQVDQLQENLVIVAGNNELRDKNMVERSKEIDEFAHKFFLKKQEKLNQAMKRDQNINYFTRNYYLAKDKKHRYVEEANAKKQLNTWRNFVERRLIENE